MRLAKYRIATAALISTAVLLCFLAALRNGFVGYDDPDYVTRNPAVAGGLSWRMVGWAFTTAHASNWHPLTWISHAIDCSLFGVAPYGHHLTSLLLHAANAGLLYMWLAGATGFAGRSAFVALAFGLHPLHVESAAWVAERKDMLCGFFVFVTLIAYSRYASRPSASRYLCVAAAFLCALLSKPMAVTLPALLLVLDWWPLRRKAWRRLLLEKTPLVALSLLCAGFAIWAQRAGGSLAAFDSLPLGLRAQNATAAYVAYIEKTLWPANLALFYPFPLHGVAAWKVAGALVVLAILGALAWLMRRDHPWIGAGLAWFAISLLPVIGLVQVGMQAMADRYMYLPMIGLLVPITWESARFRSARWAAPILLIALAALSSRQISFWRDGVALWTHTLQVTRDNFVAHDNLGVELDAIGRHDEALEQYREALRIRPEDRNAQANYSEASFARGERLFTAGNRAEALGAFREGLRYHNGNALAHSYVGAILAEDGKLVEAMREFRRALSLDPKLARAYMGLGVALARSGRTEEAESAMRLAVANDPLSVEARYDLGLIEAAQGNAAEARVSFEEALRIDPSCAPARDALAALAKR